MLRTEYNHGDTCGGAHIDGVPLANQPIREFGKRLLVLSEAPIEQIWTLLSMWESAGTARKLIKGRATAEGITIDPNLAERKAISLAYCIRTARENILASAESLTVRMVANYYGCMWFASAMMVADPNNDVDLLRLERFTKFGHGLSNLAADDQSFPDNEFLYLKESGFFPRFLKWLHPMNTDINSLCLPPPRVDNYNELATENRKFLVSLSELLARIPELNDIYRFITDRFPLSFRLFPSSKNMGENVDDAIADRTLPPMSPKRMRDYTWLGIGIPLDVPEQYLHEHGPPLEELAIREYAGDRYWCGKLHHPKDDHWYQHLPTYRSAMAPTCWIKPVLETIFDPFAIHLMLLYQLSILTRYRPAVWREIIEGDQNAFRPLILGYNSIFSRVIPEIVLHRIASERVQVTTPGSLFAPI